jgi:RNase H-like domain found in reverse transcriptase
MVGPDGIRLLGRHIKALAAFPQPASVKKLQWFLGVINFYRQFLPGIASTLRPLTNALHGGGKSFVWSPPMSAAFEAAKGALAAATPLSHPRPDATISISSDASDTHIGAVLQQSEVVGGGTVLAIKTPSPTPCPAPATHRHHWRLLVLSRPPFRHWLLLTILP